MQDMPASLDSFNDQLLQWQAVNPSPFDPDKLKRLVWQGRFLAH